MKSTSVIHPPHQPTAYQVAVQILLNRGFIITKSQPSGLLLRRVNSTLTVQLTAISGRLVVEPASEGAIMMDEPFIADLLRSGHFEMTAMGDKCVLASL